MDAHTQVPQINSQTHTYMWLQDSIASRGWVYQHQPSVSCAASLRKKALGQLLPHPRSILWDNSLCVPCFYLLTQTLKPHTPLPNELPLHQVNRTNKRESCIKKTFSKQ